MIGINSEIDAKRLIINRQLDNKVRSELGQFFTPGNIALYMASLFDKIEGNIRLLEPGVGIGSLIAAFVNEGIQRKTLESLQVDSFDVENIIKPFLEDTIKACNKMLASADISFEHRFHFTDFIINACKDIKLGATEKFTHVIMNPPYKKILSGGIHRMSLREVNIETVNLYSAFVALAVKLLDMGGELVAIIPRSFCNGTYYQSFREVLLSSGSIKHIHIFDSRNNAFSGDEVLQENIIFHFVKGPTSLPVKITSSPGADFHVDPHSATITATDMTYMEVPYSSIVKPGDKNSFIHIATTSREQDVIDRLSCFNSTLQDLDINVSTGPVVDFRHKEDWVTDPIDGIPPLLYPHHFSRTFSWPKVTRKPNSIRLSKYTKSFLWPNEGHFVLVKRFSSKEERHRIMAFVYDGLLKADQVGFENKLNVFHRNKRGVSEAMAKGLFVYLNSSLLDKYYRQFGGHTQVNASDLKSIGYPNLQSLLNMGEKVHSLEIPQAEIDVILDQEIQKSQIQETTNPLMSLNKIDQALEILRSLGLPKQQLNERSALTFLALLGLTPNGSWQELNRPMIGVTPIMEWVSENYGKTYAPNSRESFRRQTLHQFTATGIVIYNPDEPKRAVNSPKACYQIAAELHNVLLSFEQPEWEEVLKAYLQERKTLVAQYAMAREMEQIPLQIDKDTAITLSAGEHSQLIKDIIVEFGPRFAPGAVVIYVGDTGAKNGYFKAEELEALNVTIDNHGKMPDVVLYSREKNWLFLIESVTSHGPVDGKRYAELRDIFAGCTAGLVFVTAFPSRKTLREYLEVMSWESEVWFADSPTHMMHLNGDRFLGPHD